METGTANSKMREEQHFSSRWGIILASIGMAVGAGNLWRFPRLAGQYGGAFIILWICFLFIWAIPILLAEFAIGKHIKRSVISSFAGITGRPYTWMGFFIALCTLGITFYYSVVTSWSLRYLFFSVENLLGHWSSGYSLSEKIAQSPNYLHEQWASVANQSLFTIVLHVIAVSAVCTLLYQGVQKGLEKANRLLIPVLFFLLLLMIAFSLSHRDGVKGLEYMFEIKPELFAQPNIWIEALSQAAWSTGAGWGLIMTISAYSREKEDVSLNTFISGFGNNTASLVAGMAILPSVFFLAPNEQSALDLLQSGNQALTFIVIPELFTKVTGGYLLAVIFFLAFTLAAFTSLLPMLELFIKLLTDLGMTRGTAVVRVGLLSVAWGLPSAWSLDFFSNQDWVWGIGLIVSGLFICFAALKKGAIAFKEKLIDADSDFAVSNAYFKYALMINVPLALVLIWWWMSRGYSEYPWLNEYGRWNFLDVYSNATIVTQWGVILLIGIVFNKKIYDKYHR